MIIDIPGTIATIPVYSIIFIILVVQLAFLAIEGIGCWMVDKWYDQPSKPFRGYDPAKSVTETLERVRRENGHKA